MTNDEKNRDFIEAGVFIIDNDNKADWAVKKINEDVLERDRIIKIAENRILELKNEIEEIEREYDRKISFLKSCLLDYFETVDHKETKTQESYKLLSGSLVMKKPANKIVKEDDDTLVQYFADNDMDDFIKITKSPKWAEYKKRLEISGDNVVDTETGEIVDAVSIEQVPPKFDVKF